jgi:hypothetical protein
MIVKTIPGKPYTESPFWQKHRQIFADYLRATFHGKPAFSASDIALALGTTKGAVVRKAWRAGVILRNYIDESLA